MAERRQTALGVARARFVEGLPRKTRELRAALALLAGTPDEERPREELRRRLHALYASAQVFRIETLANALKDAIAQIDLVRDLQRGFSQDEIDAFATLAAALPKLGKSGGELAAAASEIMPIPSPEELSAARAAPPPTAPPPELAPEPMPPPEPKRASRAPKPSAPRKHAPVETVISVLVVDEPEQHARIRAALPHERFEVLAAADPEEALRLARSSAPDLVLVDRAIVLKPGIDLIGRLREDPLTDFIPVVLLLPPGAPLDPIAVREAGADEALVKPLDAQTVLKTVERVTRTLIGPAGASTLTGDLTVEEVADRIADEVKRGLVEATEKGRDVAVPLGDGTALLAAAWSTIGRVRAHMSERSAGRVRFREGAARGGPSFVTVVGEEADDISSESIQLAGRRIVVCDDDPAVLWFFAGLFREHGADVVETSDGMEALEQSRARRPDIVVSDILMPKLDGFGLTRALKRDPLLADVPVILLSWKEDLLQRMRDLRAGAAGYLRKEAAATQILSAVREALRPRARLETRLRAGGDVRGRLEDVGVQTLLMTVSALRPTARITLRASSSLFDVELVGGEIYDITRTASDGGFARGSKVFEGLIGTMTGRYTIADGDGSVRRSIEAPLAKLIDSSLRTLAARVDAVSGKNLAKAAEVVLDEDQLGYVLRSSPEHMERVVDRLRAGRGPRRLLLDGEVAPQVLEEVLVDLARQGVIKRVMGPDSEDRIALAREARERGLHPELSEHEDHGTLSWLPPQQRPQAAPRAERASDFPLLTLEEELAALEPPALPGESRRSFQELEPPSAKIRALDEPFDEPKSTPPAPLRKTVPPDDDEWPAVETVEDDEAWDDEDHAPPTPSATPGPLEAMQATSIEIEEGLRPRPLPQIETEPTTAMKVFPAPAQSPPRLPSAPVGPPLRIPPAPKLVEEPPVVIAPPIEVNAPPPISESGGLRIPPAPKLVEEPRKTPPATKPRPERSMGFVAWTLVILVFGLVGFVSWSLFGPDDEGEEAQIGPVPPNEQTARPPVEPTPTEPRPAQPEPTQPPVVEQDDTVAQLPIAYGREEEGIASFPGVTVTDGQGLLVLEPLAGGVPVRVRVGTRELTLASGHIGLALDAGVHHLAYQRGDRQDFVWVAIRSGKTRYVPPLP